MALINDKIVLNDKLKAIADGFRSSNGMTEKLSLDEMAVLAKQGTKLIEDVPTTQGQWACLSRASQMRDVVYTPKVDMYCASDQQKMKANTEYSGVIYSSVRALDWGFVGYGVSLYSYLTALNNPKSIIYTKKYSDYYPSTDGNTQNGVYNVYGTNCSSYVAYCLGLPYLLTTNTIPYMPYITRICEDSTGTLYTDFNALRNELKLCDLAGGVTSHIEIVTGIRRNKDGLIQEVELSDSWPLRIRKTTYTWEEFVQHCSVDYDYPFLRYNDLDTVPFPKNISNIVYSDIVTNRGDKVCIRPNMDIALNVLNASDYVGIALFKDGVQVNSQASTNDWELTGLTTGKYTAILYKNGETVTIDSANETNSTSFIVCNVTISRSGNVYTYTAEAINGVYPTPIQIILKQAYGFTTQVETIENDNFNGIGTIEFAEVDTSNWGKTSIIHCPFNTEYGCVIAECTTN